MLRDDCLNHDYTIFNKVFIILENKIRTFLPELKLSVSDFILASAYVAILYLFCSVCFLVYSLYFPCYTSPYIAKFCFTLFLETIRQSLP